MYKRQYKDCDDSKALYLSPKGLHPDIDRQRDVFEQSGLMLLSDLMDIRQIFEENPWMRFKFFEEKDVNFWRSNRQNDTQMKAYKESIFQTTERIASFSNVEVGAFLSMGKDPG